MRQSSNIYNSAKIFIEYIGKQNKEISRADVSEWTDSKS